MVDPKVLARLKEAEAFLARWDDDVPDVIDTLHHLRAAIYAANRLKAELDAHATPPPGSGRA